MIKKNTSDLQYELTNTTDLKKFLSENQEHLINENFTEMLQQMFKKSGLSKAVLAKKARTSEVYLYQIFSGERTPSRDRTICLCFGLSASLEETQQMLKHSGFAELFVRDKRDAIIIFGISHNLTLDEVNDELYSESEPTLC